MTGDTDKTALERSKLGTSIHCNCGNDGFLLKRPDGSEALQGFQRRGNKLVCQACNAEHEDTTR